MLDIVLQTQKHVAKGDKDEMIKFHALFALLHHPEKRLDII